MNETVQSSHWCCTCQAAHRCCVHPGLHAADKKSPVKVTITPDSALDYRAASILEKHLNWQIDQVRQVHREGKHTTQGLCPICLGLEDP